MTPDIKKFIDQSLSRGEFVHQKYDFSLEYDRYVFERTVYYFREKPLREKLGRRLSPDEKSNCRIDFYLELKEKGLILTPAL